MTPASEFKPSLAFGLLLQGPPKSGKTTLACQFPDVGVLDCDNNMAGAIRWLKENLPDQLNHIWIETVNIDEKGQEVPEHLRYERMVRLTAEFTKNPQIKTLLFDGLSSISTYLMDHIVANKPTSQEKKMTISDWIPFREMLSKLIIKTRATRRLVIMTAHDEVNKNDLDGSITITPNVPSKLAGTIGGFFSDVWHCEPGTVEGSYVVRTTPKPTIPSLGNSLGITAEKGKGFTFTWKDFEKILYKHEQKPT